MYVTHFLPKNFLFITAVVLIKPWNINNTVDEFISLMEYQHCCCEVLKWGNHWYCRGISQSVPHCGDLKITIFISYNTLHSTETMIIFYSTEPLNPQHQHFLTVNIPSAKLSSICATKVHSLGSGTVSLQ